MVSPKCARILLLLAAFGSTAIADDVRAASYDESVNGDLSDVPASPTLWTLGVGANTLKGGAGDDGTPDYDLVSFTIPAGMQLDSIGVDRFHNEFSLSFFGLQSGTPWLTGLGGAVTADHLIGWVLVANEDEITDLLDAFQGISPPIAIPLASGVYTLEMQDHDTTFDFCVLVQRLRGCFPAGRLQRRPRRRRLGPDAMER